MLATYIEDVLSPKRAGTAAIIHDVAPDLEHPKPPHKMLVESTHCEVVQVVQVS